MKKIAIVNNGELPLPAVKGGAVEGLIDLLLNEIQVIGTPGEGFGKCGEGYFRFSMFGSPEDTKLAAERMVALLRK